MTSIKNQGFVITWTLILPFRCKCYILWRYYILYYVLATKGCFYQHFSVTIKVNICGFYWNLPAAWWIAMKLTANIYVTLRYSECWMFNLLPSSDERYSLSKALVCVQILSYFLSATVIRKCNHAELRWWIWSILLHVRLHQCVFNHRNKIQNTTRPSLTPPCPCRPQTSLQSTCTSCWFAQIHSAKPKHRVSLAS